MATARMTQTQMVKSLAANCEIPNKTAKQFLEALSAMAVSEVEKEWRIRTARHRAARSGRSQGPHGTQPGNQQKPLRFRLRRS